MNDEIALFGRDLFGDPVKPQTSGPVAERFTFPPFTILDARGADWQERKRAWLAMGIRGEVGRDGNMIFSGGSERFDHYRVKEGTRSETAEQGSSVFDPVLTELAYRWWCPAGGVIVDPFAGGSVRGIVAGVMGYEYWGFELRGEQVAANREQAVDIPTQVGPLWLIGDSRRELRSAPYCDFLFSCPPYGNLEVYSDEPGDLSNMAPVDFDEAYRDIVGKAVARLKMDRFACFVVGDYRDRSGFYRNFVGKTVDAFEHAGASLYNEAVLATPVATAAMRVGKQFESGRKLAKTHQNVLVFVKGDWRKASRACNGGEP